jgi:hypothetical protein
MHAWISKRQCQRNAALTEQRVYRSVRGGVQKPNRNRLAVEVCIGCPGVVARADWLGTPEPRWLGAEIESR